MKGIVIFVLAILVVPGFIVHPSEAITCLDVDRLLGPCVNFLRDGGMVPEACCRGLQGLKDECHSKADRQTACDCSKRAAIALGIKQDYAESLPDKCGILISVPISPTVDCSRVSLMYESYK
ncbi:bifunctional inhibitor/lipid-transfer protein/seed storage 2S albumin superfamily protein [Artemisia annua]|uniref:Non-specific lipid-transfer protein n=1 Tax=Artemisia annua TaxID=35608 RepID=A0A2U1NWD3_ARTAN|nr:bifunctional inhibitor/lipid-transfer protein/seed storage 2S albumin superfamily protein [Artemisia annua]